MKTFLLLSALAALTLSAQTPTAITPSATGVSDKFSNYSKANPLIPSAPIFEEEEMANQLYLPKGNKTGMSAVSTEPSVSTPASSMYTQTSGGTLPVTVSKNFVGLGNGFNGWVVQGLLPPDTTMAVGLTQLVQWVNIKLTVLDKTTGAKLLPGSGYINANQIWAGLVGSVCAAQNQGDPILQYDRIADRWVLSQFAFTIGTATNTGHASYPAAPYAYCIAVSQTNDATGAYNLYQYSLTSLPDYPKLGVWPDGYYITANNYTFSTVTGGATYIGSQVCAFNRPAMIAGAAAGGVCFSGLGATHFAMLPGDIEGSALPPAGAPNYVISGNWFTLNNPPYALQLRRFHVDFVTTANSTLTDGFGGAADSFVNIPFDNTVIGSCGDGGGACVAQPGTTRVLDTLSMRPMYRLAYRNLGAKGEVLAFSQSVGKSGLANAAFAGVQLLEIRNPGANPPVVYTNTHFNPDSNSRWMGAAATDKLGNIAMGYSVGSGTVSPGIRITGRQRADLKNILRGEMNVQDGSGAQTASAQRWGDYSTMQIDPADDCTFWFTTEYLNNTSGADWATRIVAFKFASCQ